MNILFLLEEAGTGGAESFVRNLITELTDMDNCCFLCCEKGGSLEDFACEKHIRVLKTGLGRKNLFSAPKRIAELCRENRIDVIHAQFPREMLYAAISLSYQPGVKLVYTDHTGVSQGLKWRVINRFIGRKCAAAVALNDPGSQTLLENGFSPKAVRIIPNGVNVPPACDGLSDADRGSVRTELGVSEDSFLICSLARLSPEKGTDVLLDAIKLLKSRVSCSISCVIAGDGGLLDHLKARVRREDLQNSVILPGTVKDTHRLLNAADIYVSSSYKEVMSMSVLEALSCGLPCVVTDTGSSRQLVSGDDPCGICVPPGDPGALADAVEELIEDRRARNGYSENAVKKIQLKYSSRRMAQSYLEVYSNDR